MKKTYFFLIAATAMTFAGCANDDYAVDGKETAKTDAIGFNFSLPNTTRADIVGEKAAEKLQSEFVVYGTKHADAEDATAANDQAVFTNYKVVYEPGSAGKSESNTANWEYAGISPYASGITPLVGSQTVKYWDYSAANGYTFYAFAGKDQLSGKITVDKTLAATGTDATKYDKGYTVNATSAADLGKVYYSDRVEVAKEDYGKSVVLKFRNLGTRVRVGFYETVPGYSVKIDRFYFDTDASAAVTLFKDMEDESTGAFKAALWNVDANATTGNNLTVTYYGDGSSFKNQPKVTNSTVKYTGTLTLGDGLVNTTLAETSSAPTWDNGGDYTVVYPNETCATPMLVRCDYTLTALDNSGETIEVKNARVVIPAEYVQWKPNFAYTYIFKISNNTNGTTGNNPTDPDDPSSGDEEGLHPISFDAVAVDVTDGNFEDIATVSTNNVITYAKNSTSAGDYKGGNDIYVVNEDTKAHSVIAPAAIGTATGEAKVYKLNKAFTEGEVIAQLKGLPMGIIFTDASASLVTDGKVPASDGTTYDFGAKGAVKFTPAEVTTAGTTEYYAYVYTVTANDPATYGPATTYATTTTYYFKTAGDVYYPASGISAENFGSNKSNLYVQTAPGTVGVYDVKVITVK